MKSNSLEDIVIVTAGGHISSFHSGILEMYNVLQDRTKGKIRLVGALGGVSGLNNGILVPINSYHIDENKAGSMIGADRNHIDIDKVKDVVSKNNIRAIIMMGGDNHLGEAKKAYESGLPFLGWPKTMDGDSSAGIPIGWDTAVTRLAKAVRYHHNTAMTYGRIFYIGSFCRDTDWVLCGGGLYGGADRIIPGEQGYLWQQVWEKIKASYKENEKRFGVGFAVVPFSENTHIQEMTPPPKEHQKKDIHGEIKLQPKWIALELERMTEKEGYKPASEVYEYSLRDDNPTEMDKELSRLVSKECILMALDRDYGKCPIFSPNGDFYKVARAPLAEVAKKRKVKDYDFFDYEELKVKQGFFDAYHDLFKHSLGNVPKKEELVYRNML